MINLAASGRGIKPEFRSEFWLPAYLAETPGFYKEEGLEVTFITTKDGPLAFQGVHAGSADLIMLSTEPVLRAQAKGLESVIIMSILSNKPYMFVGSPAIKDVKQLKGKTIFAGAPGSAPTPSLCLSWQKRGRRTPTSTVRKWNTVHH